MPWDGKPGKLKTFYFVKLCIFVLQESAIEIQNNETEKNVCGSYGRQKVEFLNMQHPLTFYLEKDTESKGEIAPNRSEPSSTEDVHLVSEGRHMA